MTFLSTLSLRRATPPSITPTASRRYFYPRSPCGERPWGATPPSPPKAISIHALLAESDANLQRNQHQRKKFLSTLSLRRATFKNHVFFRYHNLFLSTLSLRRATLGAGKSRNVYRNFYPRSPCGERPWARGSRVTYIEISIHALLAESDAMLNA